MERLCHDLKKSESKRDAKDAGRAAATADQLASKVTCMP
jgi:hypothetical protein